MIRTLCFIGLICCEHHAVAQDYYRCVNPDGSSFYRRGGCPSRGVGTATVIGADGSVGSGLVHGPVQQQQITGEQACAQATQKWQRSQDMASRSGRPMPSAMATRLAENVRQMCGN
jgi:hypothetical protein